MNLQGPKVLKFPRLPTYIYHHSTVLKKNNERIIVKDKCFSYITNNEHDDF